MDETRETLFQKKVARERGEYPDDDADGTRMWESIQIKARAVRYFYASLVSEGFSEEEALRIVTKVPI